MKDIDVHLGDWRLNDDLEVLDIRRNLLTSREVKTQETPGMPGAHFVGVKEKPRTIEVDVLILGDDTDDYQDRLDDIADKLDLEQLEKLSFSDQNGHYRAMLDGDTDYEQLFAGGEVTLSFFCPKPFRYADQDTFHDIGTGGTITRSGRKAVYPTLTVTFTEDTDEFLIRKIDTGEQLRVQYNFTAESELIVNMARRELDIDGQQQHDRFDITETTFFTLGKTTQLEVRSAGVDNVEVSYRGRFR